MSEVKLVQQLVCTGGPLSGRTTVVNAVADALREQGYGVIVVPAVESTVLSMLGRDTFLSARADAGAMKRLQRALLVQRIHETQAALQHAEALPQERVVIIRDGAELDGGASVDRPDFADLLKDAGVTFEDLRRSYAAVIHLTTAADGAEAGYRAADPRSSHMSAAQARDYDRALRSVWAGHPRQIVVAAAADFEQKVGQAVEAAVGALHMPLIDERRHEVLSAPQELDQGKKYVGVFLGSRFGNDPAYMRAAEELGRELVTRGYGIVYGGGCVGLMGALAKSAIAAGGEVIGVIPRVLVDREGVLDGLSQLIITDAHDERKRHLGNLPSAFICLPGGYGTAEEMTQMITATQLRYHDKPTVMVNVGGFYDLLDRWFDKLAEAGMIDPQHRDIVRLADSVRQAADMIESQIGKPAVRATRTVPDREVD